MAAIVNQNPTSKVHPDTINKAITALLKWKELQSNTQKPQLLPQDEFLYLVLSLKKIPPKNTSSHTNPHKIPLPHPLNTGSELCLIIDDRPTSKLTSEMAKQKIKNDGVPVSKVIRLSKLKTDYKAFEAKRKLCDSYDMFFADKRVVTLLPKLLGKQFFKKKKLPLGVDLTRKGWKEQIERLCCSGLFYVRDGTCSVVKVGRVSMESDEIVENVGAAVDGVVEFVPKKWGGVRSLHLKLADSLPLPVYQALPDMKLKIQGVVSGDDADKGLEVVKEAIVEKSPGKKKGSEKGRIHEVRYMDATTTNTMTEVDGDDELGSEGESEDDDVKTELVSKKRKNGAANVDVGSVGKKKKKGDLVKVDSKKKSEKQGKRKAEKGDDVKEKIESESVKKGKKKADVETAIKVKKSKKDDVKEKIEPASEKKGKKKVNNEIAIRVTRSKKKTAV